MAIPFQFERLWVGQDYQIYCKLKIVIEGPWYYSIGKIKE